MFIINEILNAVDEAELLNGNSSSEISAVVTDTRKVCPGSLFLALKGEKFDGHDFLEDAIKAGATALCVSAEFADKSSKFKVRSSGKPNSKQGNNKSKQKKSPNHQITKSPNIITVPDTLVAYQKIANYYRNNLKDLTVIGVTGSCGKTSAKEILKTLLGSVYGEEKVFATESNNNNHIGVPLSLLSVKPEHRFAVIEMGTNHPGEIETLAKIAEPDIAIITSIARAHLEFLIDLDGVANEKSSILKTYGRNAPVPIIPESCPSHEILRKATGEIIYTFGAENADLNVDYLGSNSKGSRISLNGYFNDEKISINTNWSLNGKHQAMNAAAAALAVLTTGDGNDKAKIEKIKKALGECHLTGMRMQFSKTNGIEWVNDAYNANPDSMKSAIEWLTEFADKSNSHIVLGDMLEMGSEGPPFHREILTIAMSALPKANLYAVGPRMNEVSVFADITSFPDSETAAYELKKIIKTGDFVFLKASRGIALEKIQEVF